ncbi:hypothetical protein [Nakamurella leprariae]|uniref:Uncharacterized protein n=1 Tax=Nakamurella leprariae TaxID=2803911 RepID=A0A938Y6K9_9ACTN|nr:hypothetical protein [Nakamurella leprariae]MBM9466981.1 hypothetical protein [Nakamurella leprariae]
MTSEPTPTEPTATEPTATEPTATEPTAPVATGAVVILDHDLLTAGDLEMQAYARHLADGLPVDVQVHVVGGMRGVLESRRELMPAQVDLAAAQSGRAVVDALAATAGVPEDRRPAARASALRDLAASSFVLDRADGLDEVLAAVGDAPVLLVIDSAERGPVAEVLGALRLTGRIELVAGHRPTPSDLVIAAAWTRELAEATAAGATTVVVDRFGRELGVPTAHVAGLSRVLPVAAEWRDRL